MTKSTAVLLAPDAIVVAPPPALARAQVTRSTDEGILVAVEGRLVPAAVAVSCLIRPLEGDRVLTFRDGDSYFILSVLEREGPNFATLALPGNGNLAIEGETLSLNARQRLALKGGRVDLQTKLLSVLAGRTTWLGKALTTIVERLTTSARIHETSADTLTQKAGNRVSLIDEVDTLKAGTQAVAVAGVSAETAENRVIAVSGDLRVDGKRIAMG